MSLSAANAEIPGFQENLSVMDQLQKVKSYFIKVDKEFHPEKYQKKRDQKHDQKKGPTHVIIEQVAKANQKIDEKRDEVIKEKKSELDKTTEKKAVEIKKTGRMARDFMSSSSSDEEG